MTQLDAREAIERAAQSVSTAYFDTNNAALRDDLSALAESLDDLATQLDQDDLETRAEDFAVAAQTMTKTVLPGIKHLHQRVAEILSSEACVKTAMTDLLQVATATSFFKVPSI
jgi:hypothetical protein